MRVALISYEHPDEVAGGGIGTYIHQIAYSLSLVGVYVEVFAGSLHRSYTKETCGYMVHFIKEPRRPLFYSSVIEKFKERQLAEPFNIIEAPEHSADAFFIKKEFASVPLIVKLHTPTWLIDELNGRPSLFEKCRFLLGGLRRGKMAKPYWVYKKEEDREYVLTRLADAVYSPSRSLSDIVQKKWGIKKPLTIPNPYNIPKKILDIPVPSIDDKIVITFLGRLEIRKGVLLLAKAIPLILKNQPDVIFRFVGKPHPAPSQKKHQMMDDYIKDLLGPFQQSVEFLGFQNPNAIASILSETHICVFPSIWENFPNVCLEAMAAARAVVASNSGGMADMIDNGINGLLFSPKSIDELASKIIELVKNKEKIPGLGVRARKKVLEDYNSTRIGEMTKSLYLAALNQST